MPKMKTHKGTAKRFRVTGTGKIVRAKAFKSHIKSKKSPKRIRNFRKETVVAESDKHVLSVLFPLRRSVALSSLVRRATTELSLAIIRRRRSRSVTRCSTSTAIVATRSARFVVSGLPASTLLLVSTVCPTPCS